MTLKYPVHILFVGKSLVLGFLLLFLTNLTTESQVLKGRITDKSGQPVQYATVFIQELRQGTTSNTKGDYEVRLPAGKYTVLYQSLGYEPVMMDIRLSDTLVIRDVILTEQYYEIPEVRITRSGEDPAYVIMRRAIGLAPYYLNQVNYYKANVYLKGNLLINRIPKLLQRSMRMNTSEESTSVSAGGKPESDARVLKEGDSFLMESFNEIEFTAPDKYVQRVISFNSTFPDQGNDVSPMDYINASFYQPVLVDMAISPLSPQAFSHYNFKYLGASLQGNYTVNKIQVIPKRKSQQLFSGTIFLVEDLWCLHSVDLTNENLAGKIRVRELYVPFDQDIWMPVSHQFDIDLAILGIRADVGYGSSVKYLDVKPNSDLQKPSEIASGTGGTTFAGDTVKSRSALQIEKILQKEEMTNRDMMKLANLLEKETEKSVHDTIKKNLEIKDNTTRIIEKDAGVKDSAYWAEIRPIPLSDIDLRSMRKNDSLKAVSSGITRPANDTTAGKTKSKGKFRRTFNNIAFGHTWTDTTGFRFTNGGIIDVEKFSFNTVDGFICGMDFRISKRFRDRSNLSFYPDIRYAFSRDKIMWRLNANYSMAGINPGRFYINSGMASRDINTGGGINPFINTVSSLVRRRNFMKLYESRFLTLGYAKEAANGLELEFNAGFEDRRLLENNTDFSIFRPERDFSDNIPDNRFLESDSIAPGLFTDQKHFEFTANVTYTPFRKYRMFNGNKVAAGSDWPEFKFIWKHGMNQIPRGSDKYMHFDMFRLEVSQRKEIPAFSEFRWKIRTGAVTGKRNLPYFDFFHFNAQPPYILIDDYSDAFMLPEYYSLSTPEMFAELHVRYTSPYILLKLLPGLSNTLMRENLSLSFLGSRFHPAYTEIGYSLSEIFFVAELGVFAGFNDFKYSSAGIKIIFRLN